MVNNLLHHEIFSSNNLRSCKEINLTSFAKYPEVILGIAGEAHT